jgi:aldehyde:ferredoxin oxidoreductase
MSWAGRILWADLTERKIWTEPTSNYYREYVGGTGVGAKLIYDNVPPETKGLDPENLLTFNAGPLSGTLLGNKLNVMAKSPRITNNPMVTASMGGHFASELKFAGFDNIAVKGKADEPVYLYINNDEVEIRSAKHLWGMDTQVVQEKIREELRDPDVQIACIGQAGENMVAFALILHDIQSCASHGGLGAVMGSKNLKAIVVRGTKGLNMADPKRFYELWEKYYFDICEGKGMCTTMTFNEHALSEHADLYTDRNLAQWGYGLGASWIAPVPNVEESQHIFDHKYRHSNLGCAFCPAQCQANYKVPGIGNGGCACFNYMAMRFPCKTFNLDSWWAAVSAAQRYGIDTLEPTSCTGWLMFLYEKGIITEKDTDGIPMQWGSHEAMMTVLDKIAKREGFGALFADGIVPAAKIIAYGEGLRYVSHDRNISIPLEIPERGVTVGGAAGMQVIQSSTQFLWWHPPVDRHAVFQLCAPIYGITRDEAEKMLEDFVSEFAEKETGNPDAWRPEVFEGKAKYVAANEQAVSISDMTGHCDGLSARLPHAGYFWSVEDASKALTASTGRECSVEWLKEAILRRRLLELSYNILCERTIGEISDVSPAVAKAQTDAIPEGFFKGQEWDIEESEECGEEYCELMGLDPDTGIPTREALEKHGLKDVADRLEETEQTAVC